MTAARTERLMDVLFVLLNASQPLMREQIRQRVPGYDQGSDEAFQRMFERDKDALRDMGVPIELKNFDALVDEAQGYWIDRKTWLLPELHLSQSERLLITLAASAWEDQQISSVARQAAHGIGTMANRPLDAPDMRFAVGQTTLAELFSSINSKNVVEFEYQSKSSGTVSVRTVQPWRLLLTNGAWYLVGYDEERQDLRTFRLSRILGAVTVTNRVADQEVPEDLDTRKLVEAWSVDPAHANQAILGIKPGTCPNLRLRSSSIDIADDVDMVKISYGHQARLVREIAAVCNDVVSIEPQSLRDEVRNYVSRVLEVHS